MATKRQRLAQRTLGGEPTLSLPEFLATVPAAAAATPAAGRCASPPECYLVYCYLCRTGLWRDVALRVSPCGAFYLACEPEWRDARGEAARGGAAAAAASEAAAADTGEAAAAEAAAREGGDAMDVEDGDDDVSSSSGEDEEGEPATDAAHEAAAPDAGDAQQAEGGETLRQRTMMVPISVATAAPSARRMHTLLRLSEREGGAPVSLASLDSDGTVIVSFLAPGLVPPEVLETGPEAPDEDEDDDSLLLPATITADTQDAQDAAAA